MNRTLPLNWKILLVDDDKDWLEIFYQELTDIGLLVETSSGVEEAIRKVSEKAFDVVFCDLKMSHVDQNGEIRMDGGQYIIQYLKKNSPFTEVIAITGFGSISLARSTFIEGIYDFLEKEDSLFENMLMVLKSIHQKRKEKFLAPNVLKDQEKVPFDDFSSYRISWSIEIDGKWKAEEFIQLLSAVKNLYFFLIALSTEKINQAQNYELGYLDKLWIAVEKGLYETKMNEFTIEKIHFSSPGQINFQGLAEIVTELREFVKDIISIKSTIKERKANAKQKELANKKTTKEISLESQKQALEFKMQEIALQEREFELTKKKIEFLKENGFDFHEIARLNNNLDIQISLIQQLSDNEKITGTKLID